MTTTGDQTTGGRMLVYDDRDDLPPGYVLLAMEGYLSVLDRSSSECASLVFRRERWTWRAVSPDGETLHGIAPNPADAWQKIIDAISHPHHFRGPDPH